MKILSKGCFFFSQYSKVKYVINLCVWILHTVVLGLGLDWLQSLVTKFFIPTLFLKKIDWDIVNAFVRLSIRPSRFLLINYLVEFNQTCYMTFPRGKGVRDKLGICDGVPSTARSN